MPFAKNVFSCVQSHVYAVSLTSSLPANWRPCNALWIVWKYGNQIEWDLDCMLVRENLEYQFWIISTVAAAVCGRVLLWCKTTPFFSIPLHLLQIAGFNSPSSIAQYLALLTVCPWSWYYSKMGPFKSQNSVNITLSAEGSFEFLGPGQWRVFPLHALTFSCRSIVVHPCFIACDNPLQESLSFMMSLQKLHSHFHACLFVLICKLFWHPPCINFVILEILVDDRICRSAADVQLVGYIMTVIHLSFWTRPLTSSALSTVHEVVRWPEWSSSTMLVLPLWNLSTHWYTFLCEI
jgi:hypothetical protein